MTIAQTYVQQIAKAGWVSTMEHKGFSASLMKAKRLQDRGAAYGLPQGQEIPVFPISALPGSPDEWVREPGTYVCPVQTDWGIWFDWTGNDAWNTAVAPSVKGMNPITGRKFSGAILEEYVERCPVHDIPFGHNRLCEECGFRWPPQNYVTHESTLWLDGFRQPDGTVRQFFFTEDDKRDIASLVIGNKNVVPAFGFVFYEPKERREMPDYTISVSSWDNIPISYQVPGDHWWAGTDTTVRAFFSSSSDLGEHIDIDADNALKNQARHKMTKGGGSRAVYPHRARKPRPLQGAVPKGPRPIGRG